MRNKVNWEFITAHLEGNNSDEEKEQILEWIHENSENQKKFDQIQEIWNTPELVLPNPDVEKALKIVMERVGVEAGYQNSRTDDIYCKEKPKRNLLFQGVWGVRILKIAAIFLFMAASIYFLTKFIMPAPMIKVFVENGKQEKITLSDGTLVTLDSGSLFEFPETFDDDQREVVLNGEGYFEVTPDLEKSFIVHANDAIISVLGTKFNVRAWRKNEKLVVAVADGRVSLNSERSGEKNTEVIIGEGQVSIIEGNKLPSPPEDVILTDYLGWIERKMVFKSTPLREVLDQLERWYGLEFTLMDKSYGSHLITIFVDNRPIEDILEVIAMMNDFDYEQKGNQITFSTKK